ncbi:MAG TPA: HypC/HybG/HupF family hydrogenase formation chaperone [Pirellulaceae bacterium]|nr:HypC/HybG/HupF family hydrogenase formation chaperone [Pirellulaceae bacterium]
MCLGIPGKIIRWTNRDPILAQAEIEFGGVRRTCQMACVPDAVEGDYVIVHAGVAISRIDRAEAARTLAELARLAEDDGWRGEDSP